MTPGIYVWISVIISFKIIRLRYKIIYFNKKFYIFHFEYLEYIYLYNHVFLPKAL